jgi:hypothetical protein
MKARTPAPEGEAVAWRWRNKPDGVWNYQEARQRIPGVEQQPLYASPVVPVGVSREEIKAILENTVDAELGGPFDDWAKVVPETLDAAADAILAALRPTDTGWRDIATAPRDGTWVDAWRKPPSFTGPTWEPRVSARWDEDEGSWVWPCDTYEVFTVRGRELADMAIEDGDFYTCNNFTHFRPLPTTPTDTGRE